MRALVLFFVLATFTGCVATLNTAPTENRSTLTMKKPCECPGMEQCTTKTKDGSQCCKPDDCACKQITAK